MAALQALQGFVGPVLSPRQRLSDLLGSASFIVWLFAQSPQLYENYKNGSCDGLSVVFLVQWMLGDVTNLIGSVLTHQLPFQVAIATYFCCVDACILVQYGYYWRKEASTRRRQARIAKRINHRSRTADSPFADYYFVRADDRREMSAHGNEGATGSVAHSASDANSRDLSVSVASMPHTSKPWRTDRGSIEGVRPLLAHRALTMDADKNYRALGEAARSVLQLANATEGKLAERRARQKWAWSMARLRTTKGLASPLERDTRTLDSPDAQSEVGDAPWPEGMVASMSARSVSSEFSDDQRPWLGSASTPDIRRSEQPLPSSPSSRRGRGMTRMAGIVEAAVVARNASLIHSLPTSPNVERLSKSRANVSRSSTRSSISNLAAKPPGFILLGLAFFFSIGSAPLARHKNGVMKPIGDELSLYKARVFSNDMWTCIGNCESDDFALKNDDGTTLTWQKTMWSTEEGHNQHAVPPPSWDRIIGRLSAWSCTVLYMTSRMPQIWTNMQRRSVQGLSILLFIAAATGNLLYTLSILLNPQAQSPPRSPLERRTYIMESLPFLLGSGGTLIFDAIIVAQWTAWRGKAPMVGIDVHSNDLQTGSLLGSRSRSRKTSTQSRWHSLERQSLLS